jgi:hypothetical protein
MLKEEPCKPGPMKTRIIASRRDEVVAAAGAPDEGQ